MHDETMIHVLSTTCGSCNTFCTLYELLPVNFFIFIAHPLIFNKKRNFGANYPTDTETLVNN